MKNKSKKPASNDPLSEELNFEKLEIVRLRSGVEEETSILAEFKTATKGSSQTYS